MGKKETKEEDLINYFLPKKNSQDNLLATAAISLIVGSIVLISGAPSLSKAIRFLLVISICSLTISFLLLLWYNPRLETRCKLMKKVIKRRIEKVKKDIERFSQLFDAPLFREKIINNLEKLRSKKFNSKEEFNEAVNNAMNKASKDMESESKDQRAFMAELFYKDFMKDTYFMDEKIFHKPLNEDFSKIKHFFDIFSFKFRHQFFVVGVVALIFSIITHLLLK